MRASLFVLAIPLVACQAIVGTYEVAREDSGASDSATAGDANTDTAVSDTGALVVTSCKQHKALGSEPGGDGRYQLVAPSAAYPSGVWSFCEMGGPVGMTLVATRSSKTNGSQWASPNPMAEPPPLPTTVARSLDLAPGPDDKDAYLDIDWTLLGFTEVVYDLGAPDMGRAPTRITFRDLDAKQRESALTALVRGHRPQDRPDCYLEGVSTPFESCLGTTPPPDGMKAIGWAYALNNVQCYWGYMDQQGSRACDGTTVGKGRVFVR